MGLKNSFNVDSGTLRLKDSLTYQKLLNKRDKEKVKLVASEENILAAAESAMMPESVKLLKRGGPMDGCELVAGWQAKAIKLGEHSVLFGFTSDSPPADDTAAIESPDAAENRQDSCRCRRRHGPGNAAGPGRSRFDRRQGALGPFSRVTPGLVGHRTKSRPTAPFGPSRSMPVSRVRFSEPPFTSRCSKTPEWMAMPGAPVSPISNENFSEGYSFKGRFSPRLETRGRYLYLYQIVSDRGLERPVGTDVVGAAFDERKELPIADIADWSLRLSVDPRYITSWGSFKNAAFTAQVPARTRTGDVVPAADGAGDRLEDRLRGVQLSADPQRNTGQALYRPLARLPAAGRPWPPLSASARHP